MKNFVQQFSQESKSALSLCVGRPIQSVLAPSCDLSIGSSIVTTQSVSIRIGDREFLVLKNDWADTPLEYHNYYFFEASISDRPDDIKVNVQKSAPCWSYEMDHFCLRLGAQSEISTIEVLEDRYDGKTESVQYDAGLIFSLANGNRFAITREESISGFMELSHTTESIREHEEALTVRYKYGV